LVREYSGRPGRSLGGAFENIGTDIAASVGNAMVQRFHGSGYQDDSSIRIHSIETENF